MVISNIKNLDKFFALVDKSKGKVELVTKEGDRLNLKSKLSQYVAFAKVFSDGTIPEMELKIENPDDAAKFVEFMFNGNK